MSTTTGGRMPLLEHLRELRKRVVRSAAAISIAAIVGWVYYTPIITTLAKPVCDLKTAQETGADNCGALYINGVLDSSATISQFQAVDFQSSYNSRIGAYGDASNNPNYFLNGSLAQFQIYNRALSATEILQNYNATRKRFGL